MQHRLNPKRYEHRDVWIAAHGKIPFGHHIHHKNRIRSDNRIENLECIEAKAHMRLHGKIPSPKKLIRLKTHWRDCWSCTKHFKSFRGAGKFCSKACLAKYNNWLHGCKRAVKRQSLKPNKPCVICATVFEPFRGAQVCCSRKCTIVRSNRIAKEKKAA